MKEPNYQFYANLGDDNPLEYGGVFVFIDQTDVYNPEMAFLDVPDEEDSGKPYKLYRFDLEKHIFTSGVLSDNKFHPEHETWYADDVLSGRVNENTEWLISALCADNIKDRAAAYYDLVTYWGADNFDSYPVELTRKEASDWCRTRNIPFQSN